MTLFTFFCGKNIHTVVIATQFTNFMGKFQFTTVFALLGLYKNFLGAVGTFFHRLFLTRHKIVGKKVESESDIPNGTLCTPLHQLTHWDEPSGEKLNGNSSAPLGAFSREDAQEGRSSNR